MKKLSPQYQVVSPLKEGEIVKGKIIEILGNRIFVDLGPQGTGIVEGREFYLLKNHLKELNSGKEIVAKVILPENEEGFVELSLKDVEKETSWQKLQEKKEKKEKIKVKILGANKGGLLTKIYGFAAFLPVSQLASDHYPKVEGGDPQKILKALQKFIGKEMEVQIFSLDQKNWQIILSEKLKEIQEKSEILKEFKEGDIVEGEITGLCDFGAFLRFKSKKKDEFLEGLIHISELSWQLIEDPQQVVKVGQKVKAKILQIQNERVFLSLKALEENPWQKLGKKIKKGQIIEGKVKKLAHYGALIEIFPKIYGLCHISEFGTQKKMEEKLKINQTYHFKVLMVDEKESKIILEFKGK